MNNEFDLERIETSTSNMNFEHAIIGGMLVGAIASASVYALGAIEVDGLARRSDSKCAVVEKVVRDNANVPSVVVSDAILYDQMAHDIVSRTNRDEYFYSDLNDFNNQSVKLTTYAAKSFGKDDISRFVSDVSGHVASLGVDNLYGTNVVGFEELKRPLPPSGLGVVPDKVYASRVRLVNANRKMITIGSNRGSASFKLAEEEFYKAQGEFVNSIVQEGGLTNKFLQNYFLRTSREVFDYGDERGFYDKDKVYIQSVLRGVAGKD